MDAGRDRRPETPAHAARHPRDPGSGRVQLRPCPERLLRPARRTRGRAARAQARGRRRLPGAGGLPRLALVGAARPEGARDRRRQPALGEAAGVRRPRHHDRPPRHRPRSRPSLPARADPAGHQCRRPRCAQRNPGGRRPRRLERARAARYGDGRPTRRRGRSGRDLRGRDRCVRAPDPRRRLAARPDRELGRLRAHRPADRGARAGRRSQPRRRRP